MNLDPTNENEAVDLVLTLSEKFNFRVILLQTSDFEDMMGTEDWTAEDINNALDIATEEVAETVGFAIQNAIEETR